MPGGKAKEMTRATVIIQTETDRARIAKWAWAVPFGTRVEFKEIKRSLPQNDRMWAMLTDVSKQVPWHGIRLSADDWKLVFMDALKRELRMVPNLEGTGFVSLGRSSSDLSIEEMTGLIELIFEFGARHGVIFKEPEQRSAAA